MSERRNAARALQLACATNVIDPVRQGEAQASFVGTLASNLESHLAGCQMLPSEYLIMQGVLRLSTV